LALFLDFDGTLAALRRLPSDVKPLDLSLRWVLRSLARHKRLTLYVISGRRLAELRKLVPVRGIHLLGLHGWEGRHVPLLIPERTLLRKAKRLLDQRLSNAPEIRLEDKGLGLAVHYRGASPRAVRLARAIVGRVLRHLEPHIHMLRGHKVWELLPRQIAGKGASVLALLSRLPSRTLPIFVGDDATDESAFRVLPGGLTIRVGKHPRTAARFLLESPEEVKLFLLRLEAAIAAGGNSSGAQRR
jgi:trehalose 6-phosphate phosphatase